MPYNTLYQRHVTSIKEEDAWEVEHNQAPPYVNITIEADFHAYGLFRDKPLRSLGPHVDIHPAVDTYMFTYTNSDINIITLAIVAMMGYNAKYLMEVSAEGLNLLRDAGIDIRRGLFATIRVTNPATLKSTYTNAMVYVADSQRNHMSRQTVESLSLRGNRTLGDLIPLYIPRNT